MIGKNEILNFLDPCLVELQFVMEELKSALFFFLESTMPKIM